MTTGWTPGKSPGVWACRPVKLAIGGDVFGLLGWRFLLKLFIVLPAPASLFRTSRDKLSSTCPPNLAKKGSSSFQVALKRLEKNPSRWRRFTSVTRLISSGGETR